MFILIFNQLVKMLIILIVGIVCVRIGLVSKEGSKTISNLLLMLVNPILIIMVYQTDYDPILVKGLLFSFVAAFISHILAILVSKLLFRDKEDPNNMINQFAAVYSNCGFIGIPLINSVLGSEGVFYLTAYMTVFNILTWTHGLSLMKGHFDQSCSKRADCPNGHRHFYCYDLILYTDTYSRHDCSIHAVHCRYEYSSCHDGCRFSVANSDIKDLHKCTDLSYCSYKTHNCSSCGSSLSVDRTI